MTIKSPIVSMSKDNDEDDEDSDFRLDHLLDLTRSLIRTHTHEETLSFLHSDTLPSPPPSPSISARIPHPLAFNHADDAIKWLFTPSMSVKSSLTRMERKRKEKKLNRNVLNHKWTSTERQLSSFF